LDVFESVQNKIVGIDERWMKQSAVRDAFQQLSLPISNLAKSQMTARKQRKYILPFVTNSSFCFCEHLQGKVIFVAPTTAFLIRDRRGCCQSGGPLLVVANVSLQLQKWRIYVMERAKPLKPGARGRREPVALAGRS
jgi:hypothetical protein